MEHVLPGPPPVRVALRRSARARRLSLRVSAVDGRATLTLPARTPLREGLAFLQAREGWLRGHVLGAPPPVRVAFGAPIPFEGHPVTLRPGPGRRTRLAEDALLVPGPAEALGPRVAAFLKAAARGRLAAACDRHAAALGRPYRRLSLRDPRSRWGSCTGAGDLMFSWRLIMAPPEVLDYVAAHEVAHLERMDHSPAFWAVVERLVPGHAGPRAWLRADGGGLHRLRFAPEGG